MRSLMASRRRTECATVRLEPDEAVHAGSEEHAAMQCATELRDRHAVDSALSFRTRLAKASAWAASVARAARTAGVAWVAQTGSRSTGAAAPLPQPEDDPLVHLPLAASRTLPRAMARREGTTGSSS